MPRNCCVPYCENTSNLHNFPKDPNAFTLWATLAGREDILKRLPQEPNSTFLTSLRKSYAICDIHFKEEDKFPPNRNRTNLKYFVYPSLHLPKRKETNDQEFQLNKNSVDDKITASSPFPSNSGDSTKKTFTNIDLICEEREPDTTFSFNELVKAHDTASTPLPFNFVDVAKKQFTNLDLVCENQEPVTLTTSSNDAVNYQVREVKITDFVSLLRNPFEKVEKDATVVNMQCDVHELDPLSIHNNEERNDQETDSLSIPYSEEFNSHEPESVAYTEECDNQKLDPYKDLASYINHFTPDGMAEKPLIILIKECDICKKTNKPLFECEGCKVKLCRSCGNLTTAEVNFLLLQTRVLKFFCKKCSIFSQSYKKTEMLHNKLESKFNRLKRAYSSLLKENENKQVEGDSETKHKILELEEENKKLKSIIEEYARSRYERIEINTNRKLMNQRDLWRRQVKLITDTNYQLRKENERLTKNTEH